MKKKDFVTRIAPRLLQFKLHRYLGKKKIDPMTLTFSVTAACQSRCKTCQIGDLYLKHPERAKKDLSTDEIEKIFKTMKPVYFFNISGGEPFIRKDIPQIVELALKYLHPRLVHIPTNAIMPARIEEKTREILEIIKKYDPEITLTVKPSIDGTGGLHDEIRGVPGNFKRLLNTIDRLKKVRDDYPNFHLELGTVVSNFNIGHLDEIEDFVHSLDVGSYRNEVAEQRAEFFNIGDPITPDAATYQRLMKDFARKIEENIASKSSYTKLTEAQRIVYYGIAGRILEEQRQVIPCYAGVSNVHINYDGGVWPCCVLGYDKQMGNLRDFNYDFQKLWYSDTAKAVRRSIKNKECACPLANQSFSNILLHTPSLMKAVKMVIKFS